MQAILAPIQFAVFLVSLVLVIIALVTGAWETAAAISIIIKTALLFTIMVTGAIWERAVFGQYLFARSFFWEDVVSFGVIALHTAYLVMFLGGIGTAQAQLTVALAAYAAYVVNAAQFLMKMAVAKREERASAAARAQQTAQGAPAGLGAAA